MILSVPYQALEIGNIHLTYFTADRYGKSIAKLLYKDPSIDFQDLSILSPPLKVIEYNSEITRLSLDLKDHPQFQIKLLTFQEYLTSTLHMHQNSFNITKDDIRSLFTFLISGSTLNLYTYPNTTVKKNDGTTVKISEVKNGDTIRCIIRIQGITTTKNNKYRLVHSVPAVWQI
jgi:hypothetical protein